MKTIYNKSRIMKEANRLMKYDGLNRSQALKLAWSTAKRNSFYQVEVRNESNNIAFDIAMLGNTLINYYANYAYNGD